MRRCSGSCGPSPVPGARREVQPSMSINERLEQLFDLPILSHGFAPYQRDYVLECEIGGQSEHRGHYRFTFTHCVTANLTTTVRDDTWRLSWDDRFIDY